MAFKIKNPLHFDGTVNPGKKLETNKPLTKKDSPDFAQSGVGSKIITNEQYRSSGKVPKGMENVFSGKGTLRVSKDFGKSKSSEASGRKVSSSTTSAYGSGGTAESLLKGGSGKKVTKGKTQPTPPKDKKPKTIVPPSTETKASGKQSKLSKTSLGKSTPKDNTLDAINKVSMKSPGKNKKSAPQENTLDAINKVSMKKFVPASRKTTVKAAPKDNSRKAIKARKTADKKAGVSKSQMRANKAKSKSEAASAKAKKSKNPSYRAQLTAKSERLAKRAERKGGSPAKKVGDTGLKTKKQTKKEMPYNNDPVKHFNSFGSKATQRTAKNPYPSKSDRNRKFAQLQKNLTDSSR